MTTPQPPPYPHSDWGELVQQALAGNERAWRILVDRLSGVVWKVLNSFALEEADRDDAFASTFFRLYSRLSTIEQPDRLPGWVATTARNEARALWRARQRTVPVAELPLRELRFDAIDEGLLDDELIRAALAAFKTLPPKAQTLLRLLTAVPPLSYKEIAEILGIPRGSIGPTAGRNLSQLRRLLSAYDSETAP